MTWDHLHEEDILYEFRGDDPSDLESGRFYRGTVDGFAEFGVFITIGKEVTGLLHRSKLDRRLESLEWDVGDEVIVQVEGVRDNGNVDLNWSIRQRPEEFRGHDVSPSADAQPEPAETETGPEVEREPTRVTEERSVSSVDEPSEAEVTTAIARETVEDLAESDGERVRLEGRITGVRQTSGPTIFSLTDESGTIECAAFESAGVRAYPTIEEDDVVRVIGVVERHRGDIQVETESIESLTDEERETVIERLRDAARDRAQPNETSLLLVDPVVADLTDDLIETATRLRRAVFEGRRIVIRHPASADGVIAGAAIERAIDSLHDREGPGIDGPNVVERRPMDDPWYEMGDAMYDMDRAEGEDRPLVALVGAGTDESDDSALKFLDIYEVPVIVVDAYPRGAVEDDLVAASALSHSTTTASVLAAHVAGMVDERVRDELAPLPAISYRTNPPDRYADLAAEHGLDDETIRERHEAVALTAYYQRYDDKRELIADLLFDEDAADLAAHVSAQYRERVGRAVETARTNGERISGVDRTVTVVDGEAHSHRFDFPSRDVLTAELFRAEREAGEADVVLVLGSDECYLEAGQDLDLPGLKEAIAAREPHSGIEIARDRLTFLAGSRDAVRDSIVEELVGNA